MKIFCRNRELYVQEAHGFFERLLGYYMLGVTFAYPYTNTRFE